MSQEFDRDDGCEMRREMLLVRTAQSHVAVSRLDKALIVSFVGL